jgi:uncharacterized iron-regulated membrane protein
MKLRFLARKTHKWIALLLGAQVLIWVISGLYMTIIDIDLIHGDHLVKSVQVVSLGDKAIAPLPAKAFQRYGNVSAVELTQRMGQPVYMLSTEDGQVVLDAANGNILDELTQQDIEWLAQQHYAGDADMIQARRLEQYPSELGGRHLPVWRVTFDDWLLSTLYFDVYRGDLIRKRSDLWRWFDFFWMLHIMDYETRDNINNKVLRVAAGFGVIMSFTGLMLVLYRFSARRKAS